ncbi:MAG: RNA methyltransferase, partial [Bacteroidales bacterium]|nr:RNA methyltransferase [Candidatus Cryptobacteroides aphodequi]
VVQSTMGAILRRQVCYCDIAELCRSFKAEGRRVCGTFMKGENLYTESLPQDCLLVMGSESHGISEAVGAECSDRLTIPRFTPEGSESLNVAVATAICVSEFKSHSIK